MSVAFDTLKFVERLEAGGFTHLQAKAAAEAFADATGQELATKRDLKEVETSLQSDMAAVKADIAAVRAELKETERALEAKIENVETRLQAKIETSAAGLKVDILRWLIVTQIGLAGFIFAAMKFVK